jgi:hypothetical protein
MAFSSRFSRPGGRLSPATFRVPQVATCPMDAVNLKSHNASVRHAAEVQKVQLFGSGLGRRQSLGSFACPRARAITDSLNSGKFNYGQEFLARSKIRIEPGLLFPYASISLESSALRPADVGLPTADSRGASCSPKALSVLLPHDLWAAGRSRLSRHQAARNGHAVPPHKSSATTGSIPAIACAADVSRSFRSFVLNSQSQCVPQGRFDNG